MMPLIQFENVSKTYATKKENNICILENASFSIMSGDLCALVAPSGTGKSTLLHLMGLLDTPSSGIVSVLEKPTAQLTPYEKAFIRNQHIGFVYQFHHLLPEFSSIENVMMPQLIHHKNTKENKEYAFHLLERLGLSERLKHRPHELSGGEQQRVAIARALANKPKILLADEPTGNLDLQTGDTVFQMLLDIVSETQLSCFIVTHNNNLAKNMNRIFTLQNKQCIEIQKESLQ